MNTIHPRIRRSPLSMVAGIALVLIGSLASVGIHAHLSNTQEVIAVRAEIPRGQKIERTDLAIVAVSTDPTLKPLKSSQLTQVVGQYATTDLKPGSLLVADDVGGQPQPGLGGAAIGVSLKPGEYPDQKLTVGDRVLLVEIPDRIDTDLAPASFPGTVGTITSGQGNSMTVITVFVQADDAPLIAVLSASNKVALVLLAQEY
ncbi:MAG: SAF domain-containing protein [Propionibacteriaceae bacterium]|nr:SAF domain-containing protein [Propionibacteriaceae bacterium]